MTHKDVLLHLSLIDSIGPVSLLKLMSKLTGPHIHSPEHAGWSEVLAFRDSLDLPSLYDYSLSDFAQKLGCSDRFAQTVSKGLADRALLNRELDLIKKHDVSLVTIFDAGYPQHLRNIYAPPPILYVRGDASKLSLRCIALVGSRGATDYAKRVIDDFVPTFVDAGFTIVSGGAQGADTMAHERALLCGGHTTVVLGSGLLHLYPASNKQLFKRVEETGNVVISPFAMQTRPDRSTFPARNRVISGLSEATVVVQAAQKSGALITAQFAVDQGRQVFAVPGSIYEDLSAGCHELLQQGAIPATSAHAVLNEIGYSDIKIIPATLVKPFKISSTEDTMSKRCERVVHPILSHLVMPQTLDQLIEKTNLSFDDLQNQLFDLQLEGKVKQNFVGMWEKTL